MYVFFVLSHPKFEFIIMIRYYKIMNHEFSVQIVAEVYEDPMRAFRALF